MVDKGRNYDHSKHQGGLFTDGYLDGWHELKPGIDPGIPAHSISAGKTPYEHGYDLGKKAAKGQSVQ